MDAHLFLRHRNDEVLVLARRHLQGHTLLGAADEASANQLAHAVQVVVADDLARCVTFYALVLEKIIRSQTPLVSQFHHRIQLFHAVLQRSA